MLLDELRRRRAAAADAYERPADDPDALAILQYTSGSTSDPKGVMLPHRCVTANIDAIVDGGAASTPATTSACRGCRSTTTWG